MKPQYHTVEEMLAMVDEPNRSACLRILMDHRTLFQTVQGSTNNHQAWPGGYLDHVQEIMNIAVVLYLHDIEKPWKYELREDGKFHHRPSMSTKEDHQAFRMVKLAEYGIIFTPEQENGIKYAEGELTDYSNTRRVMGPLACVAHMCDVPSARLWFDFPMEENDPWRGAKRNRD